MEIDIRKELTKEVGARLKSFRKSLGLSQKDLAAKLKTPMNYISRYESGRYFPPYPIIKKMEEIFGLDIRWLATGFYSKDFERERREPLIYEYRRLFQEEIGMKKGVRALELFFNPERMPITAKMLQEKLNISPHKADNIIIDALRRGFLVGLGNERYILNPFIPFAFSIKDPNFLKNISQLELIYLENNKEKVAKIKGMLDMADPGFQKIFDSLYKKEEKKDVC